MTDNVLKNQQVFHQPVDVKVLVFKIAALLGLVYLFILSITLLGESFNLMGKDFADALFGSTSNPIIGLMLGIITTAIIQSSSTTTSMIVGLVGTGMLPFEAAIPMVMGANIGTSVTNILVSMGHITRGDEFKRAFTGSMLHDFFNVCAVAVLLPFEIWTGIIAKSAKFMESIFTGFGGMKFISPLKAITKPVANGIIKYSTMIFQDGGETLKETVAANNTSIAIVTVIISLLFLFVGLYFIVKTLKSLVLSKVEKFFQRFIFRTPVLSFILGIALTTLVQSSSITTSLVVPLLGAGVISINQIYPYLLGANIGTTITAFLASFVTGSPAAVAVAFAHLIFNMFGIAIFWPLKKIPIWMATKLSELTQRSKIVPILYILVVFFIIPGLVIYLYN